MNAGDEVRFSGRVFSTALGDPWMDVDTFEVINKVKKRLKSRILLNKVWIRLWQMTIQNSKEREIFNDSWTLLSTSERKSLARGY